MLEQLKGDLFEVTRAVPATWLRSRNRCKRSAILCLIKLLEWFEPPHPDEPVPDLELRILAAQSRWRSQTAWHFLGHPHLYRGGGKQGKLPWESSSSVQGMRMVTEVASGDTILPQIYAQQICKQATGVALTLLSSLSAVQNIEAEKPLLLVFPGHCVPVLKKLGCSPGRIEEIEVILEEPSSKTMVKRKAKSLSLSSHQYSYGHGLTAVEWSPSASSEYVVEMDERWAPPVNIAAASQDWKALASDVLSKLCMESVPSDQLYAFKDVVGPPRLWTLKAKLTPEMGEKMLCASGQQGVFVRPLDPSKDSCASQYTIVWGPKHIEASAHRPRLKSALGRRSPSENPAQAKRPVSHP